MPRPLIALVACVLAVAGCRKAAPPEAPQADAKPAAESAAGKSLLIVGGHNYEDLARVPFFVDPRLKRELEALGYAVGECRWGELTWDKLRSFDAAVFLQTPNLPSGEIERGQLFAKMRDLAARFLEAGGGVLVFPDLFRGRIEPTINAFLRPYDLQVTSRELHVNADLKRPFQAYPALGRALSGELPAHAANGGARHIWLPVGSELTFALELGPEWTPLVPGPEGSWAEQTETSGGSRTVDKSRPPIVAAARAVGPGRLAVLASHSSFWVLNPYHDYWDGGAILEEADGKRFLQGVLRWLASVPANAQLGGFTSAQQDSLDARGDRREKPSAQTASYPAQARRGVIGLDPGAGAALVAPLCAEAKKLGLDYVVFTPEASAVEKDADWDALLAACRQASTGDFRAWPGALFHSEETGNTGLAFNLKKRWPETPWRGDTFEAFVRVGVNNDWESVVTLLDPAAAPFPHANLGAVTSLAVRTWDSTAGSWREADGILREAVSGGWKLMPVVYRAVRDVQELAAAAAEPTTLYLGSWPQPGGAHQRWELASTGAGVIKKFSVQASNTWEPPDYSTARVEVRVENLPAGAHLELFGWHRLLRRVPVADGRAETTWEGVLPGAGMFWIQAVGPDGRVIMEASPLAVAKIGFSAFVGTDMMNGYWYPARRVAASEKDAILLGGAYGQLGTSVYPQLGWGGHWQFRTLNQIGEPLGFEIGSPPGGLPKMTAGFRWPEGTSLPELAPVRTLGVNSTQAVLWNDRDSVLRRDRKIAGKRRLSVEPVPGIRSSLRTTGCRWWEHAALQFEASAILDAGNPMAAREANLATAQLGDPASAFSSVSVWQDGAISARGLGDKIPLPAGAGASLGDRPMGMVSLWSLAGDLELRVARDGDKPVLSLWQAGQAGSTSRAADFLLVISAHHPGRTTTLADVAAWLFDTATWQRGNGAPAFSETLDLAATRGAKSAWQGAGKPWRGRLLGLVPGWDAAALWRADGSLRWQPLPWQDPSGLTPALVASAPAGDAFLGHPVIASDPDILVSVLPPQNGGAEWRVLAHNPGAAPRDATLRTHPALAGLAAPWETSATLAPGETKSWPYQP